MLKKSMSLMARQLAYRCQRWFSSAQIRNDRPRSWSKYQQTEYNAYFSDKQGNMSPKVQAIIAQIGLSKVYLSKVHGMLGQYLQIHGNIDPTSKSRDDLVQLLVAVHLSGFRQLQSYSRAILEHLIMLQNQEIKLDSRSIGIFINVVQQSRRSAFQLRKSNHLKYMLMNAIKNNFEQVDIALYPVLINIIYDQVKSNVFEPFRFIAVVDLVQQKMYTIFKGELQRIILSEKYRMVLDSQFIEQITELYQLFGPARAEYTETLFRFITERYFVLKIGDRDRAVSTFNCIYRYFPNREVGVGGSTYKRMLLDHVIGRYESNLNFKNCLFAPKYGQYLCYSILTHCFSEFYRTLPFQATEEFTYLTAQKLSMQSLLQLPEIFWQIYKQIPEVINDFSLARSVIGVCYPERYIDRTAAVSEHPSQTSDSEMRIRVSEVLQGLGMESKCEAEVAGRKVDFQLQNRVVLQMDGSHHYSPRAMELNDGTEFRNAHLLLVGYRLVTLSIFQYNIHREKPELAALLSRKLALIRDRGAVLVF